MNPFPVSASGLRCRDLRMQDGVVNGAGLFPFFDRQGRVRGIMLLTPEPGSVHLVPWGPELARVPTWGPICWAGERQPLRAIEEEAVEAVRSLWHFDPWRVLDDEAYAGHWAATLLKATNCAGQLTRNVKMLYFRRDLSRIVWINIRTKVSSKLKGWSPELLPPSPEPGPEVREMPRPTTLEWRLDPIWGKPPRMAKRSTTPRSFSEARPRGG